MGSESDTAEWLSPSGSLSLEHLANKGLFIFAVSHDPRQEPKLQPFLKTCVLALLGLGWAWPSTQQPAWCLKGTRLNASKPVLPKADSSTANIWKVPITVYRGPIGWMWHHLWGRPLLPRLQGTPPSTPALCVPLPGRVLDQVPCIYGAEHRKSDGCCVCASTVKGCALLLRTAAPSRSEVARCEILTGKAPTARSRGRLPARSMQGTGTSELQVARNRASRQPREWARNCI